MKKRTIYLSILATFLVVLSVFLIASKSETRESEETPTEEVVVEAPPEPFNTTITLGATGDILIHDRVYDKVETPEGYDFTSMFAEVKPMLSQPDFLIVNMESMPGGTELGLSGYPSFNSPHEIVDTLIDCGVDLFSQANNHTLDQGVEGIESSINYYNQKSVPYVGMYESFEDQATTRVFDVEGIKIGVMSYTYGTNGIPVPVGQEYLVNYIDYEQIQAEAEKLNREADVVIAVMHWGNEYEMFPSDYQEDVAQLLADCGVDIIFGSHPHVLQPVEWITGVNGNKTLCVYSLGNFFSGQTGDYKDIGGMIEVTITKTKVGDESTITIYHVQFYPTYVTTQGPDYYQAIPMEQAPEKGLSSPTEDEVYNFVMNGVNDSLPVTIK